MLTIWTSDRPRHKYLVNKLSEIDSVCVIVHKMDRPHTKIDDPVMDEYFHRMDWAERLMFPDQTINAFNVFTVTELNDKIKGLMPEAFLSDTHVVFGCGWIKPPLYDLISDKAINIHMGVGYRGASCNAHAMYDGRRHLVGATIQHLSKDLDNGDPIFYAYGDQNIKDSMIFGMSAVKNAIDKLTLYLSGNFVDKDVPEDKFTCFKKKSDFTVGIAEALL